MDEKNVLGFKTECMAYLYTVSIHSLRSYGRYLSLRNPSVMKKSDLISMILRVLVGETKQTRVNQGAPIKNNFFEPNVAKTIEGLKEKYGLLPIETEEKNAQPETSALQEKSAETGKDEESVPVCATFEVNVSALNAKQKKIIDKFFKQFINYKKSKTTYTGRFFVL